jgi:hypothetical protein
MDQDAVGMSGQRLRHIAWPWPGEEPTSGPWVGLQPYAEVFDQAVMQNTLNVFDLSSEMVFRPLETASDRVAELLEQYGTRVPQPFRSCPCAGCVEARRAAGPPSGLPPCGPDESHVYLLDGPHADTVVSVGTGCRVWAVLSLTGTTTAYMITETSVCDIMGMGHPVIAGFCGRTVRTGQCGGSTPLRLGMGGERVLDALMPEWRSLVPSEYQGTLQQVVPPGGYVRFPVPDTTVPVAQTRENGWLSRSELNWPSPDRSAEYGTTCAHICGGDHECEARASTSITFDIPSGGKRSMPVCTTCYDAEMRETMEDQETKGAV